MNEIEIALEAADSAHARYCLSSYYVELESRFDTGFDPEAVKNFDPAEMTPPKGYFVVARRDGEAVGCGALKVLEPGIGEIKRVWVSNTARGQGLAGRLMDRLESIAQEAGLAVLRLDTNKTLVEAHALYRKRGYHEIARYNDNPYADHWFEKRL
jgi:ribosomal protein S18 acetylase RimI-like enzyme